MGTCYQKTEPRIGELADRIDGIEGKMEEWKTEIIRHFDMAVEQIRHDLLGANSDEIEVLEDRLTQLEQHTGLPA